MLVKIYTLNHPVTKEVRYVGRTTNTLPARRAQHIYNSKKSTTYSYNHNWIKSLSKQGLKPEISIIEVVDCSWLQSHQVEEYWISQFFAWGFRLTNSSHAKGPGHCQMHIQKSLEACAKEVHQYGHDGNYIMSYPTARIAQKSTGINYKDISANCTGRRNSAGGYRWSFNKVEGMDLYAPPPSRAKMIFQYTLDGYLLDIHESSTQASMRLGLSQPGIATAARKTNTHSAGGYKWNYKL